MKIIAKPIYVLNVFFLTALIIMNINFDGVQNYTFEQVITFLSITSIILMLVNILMIREYHLKFWDFRIYYIVLNLIFIMGNVWLVYLEKSDYITWNLLFRADKQFILKGGLFALCAHQACICGMFFKRTCSSRQISMLNKDYSSNVLWNAGLTAFLVLFPFKLYYDIAYMVSSRSYGGYLSSADIYVNGYVYCFGVVSIVGIIYMISSKHLSKSGAKLLIFLLTVYTCIVMFGTGDRRLAVMMLLSCILCYMKTYNVRIKVTTIIPIILLGYLALVTLNVIQKTRIDATRFDFGYMFGIFVDKTFSFDILWESLSEFGITIMAYVYTLEYFPYVFSYRMGSQILYNIVTVLPLGGFLKNWRISSGIQTVVNASVAQPVGGSLATDLYGNFGLFSIFLMFITGIMLKNAMNEGKVQDSKYSCAVYFSFFCILLNIIRAGFSDIIRNSVMCFLIPLLLIKFFKQREG